MDEHCDLVSMMCQLDLDNQFLLKVSIEHLENLHVFMISHDMKFLKYIEYLIAVCVYRELQSIYKWRNIHFRSGEEGWVTGFWTDCTLDYYYCTSLFLISLESVIWTYDIFRD